jgi:uncharacterized membrane protein required for colicin V production
MINGLDIVIVTLFLGIIAVGFMNGVSRVSSAILAIYFAAVFSAAFYRPVSSQAREFVSSMTPVTSELFFFVILFLASAAAFGAVIQRWLGDLKLPRRIEIIDNAGGAALGVVVSGLAVTLASMVLSIMLHAINQTVSGAGNDSIVDGVRGQIDGSTLVPVFLRMAPFFVQLISPWFPSGLPPILSGVPLG